jgi:hypothetical protein
MGQHRAPPQNGTPKMAPPKGLPQTAYTGLYLTRRCDTLRVVARKNPHAVALGRKGGAARMANLSEKERQAFHSSGGLAGGKARAEKLSAARKTAIARKAGLASAAARRKLKKPAK